MKAAGNYKPLHQQFSELDNMVFSAFCDSFSGVSWLPDFKDEEDEYSGIDLQLTAKTKTQETTYDVELKSVHLQKWLDYCFFQTDKWSRLLEWDNTYKLYVVIYPLFNRIAIWRVNRQLLESSEKDFVSMNGNSCKSNDKKEKLVYKLRLADAKVYQFDLTACKDQYRALHQQISKKGKK